MFHKSPVLVEFPRSFMMGVAKVESHVNKSFWLEGTLDLKCSFDQ